MYYSSRHKNGKFEFQAILDDLKGKGLHAFWSGDMGEVCWLLELDVQTDDAQLSNGLELSEFKESSFEKCSFLLNHLTHCLR